MGARRHQARENSAWAVPNTRACSSRARERGDGALEENFRRGTRWESHNCAWDKSGGWELLGSPESKEAANSTRDPQQAAAQPVTHSGVLGLPAAPSPVPSELRHRSPSPAAAHGVVAERAPGRAQQQAMRHVPLHAGRGLLGGDPTGDEAAGTSTGPCRRHWGDSTLVRISSAELPQQRRAQTPPTPRTSSAAHKPGLPSHVRATAVRHPSSQVTEHASGYQRGVKNLRSGPWLPSPCGSPQREDCPEISSTGSCGWWQIPPASPRSHGCPAAHSVSHTRTKSAARKGSSSPSRGGNSSRSQSCPHPACPSPGGFVGLGVRSRAEPGVKGRTQPVWNSRLTWGFLVREEGS